MSPEVSGDRSELNVLRRLAGFEVLSLRATEVFSGLMVELSTKGFVLGWGPAGWVAGNRQCLGLDKKHHGPPPS